MRSGKWGESSTKSFRPIYLLGKNSWVGLNPQKNTNSLVSGYLELFEMQSKPCRNNNKLLFVDIFTHLKK